MNITTIWQRTAVTGEEPASIHPVRDPAASSGETSTRPVQPLPPASPSYSRISAPKRAAIRATCAISSSVGGSPGGGSVGVAAGSLVA
jgi:hypothetical protein